ncbi:hypothetical protein M9H77_00202 [Catharanthus roseus]|nr:hypothetical protein M9H77_00202 [Catharanthus roseus]
MESSSSQGDIKALSVESKQDVTDAANTIEVAAAETVTRKSVEENPAQISVSVGGDDESNVLEDVKVCDICGDPGREDLLATCSKCSDGAEHIYCMRIQLDKVPDSDWVCEDCVLSEDKEKRRPTKFSSFVTSPKYNKNELDQEVETSGATSLKVNPVSGSKGLDIDKNRRDKLSCLPSSKRPLSSVHSALLMRRRARGLTNILTSTKQSKAPSSRDFAKSNEELSSSKDLSARSTRENTELLSVSSQSLSKSRQLPTSSGVFTKSKSFNGSDGKPKVQFLDKGSEKRKFSYETAVSTKGKGCAARSLQKSLSFSDANAGRSNSLDVETKTNAPKPSEFKRLRHVKDCSSVDMEVKPLLKKPRVLSPDGSFSSVSSGTASGDEVKKSSTKANPSQELKLKGEKTPSFSLTSRRHLGCSGETGQNKLPALERTSLQNQKVPEISNSALNSTRTSDGGSAPGHKCETAFGSDEGSSVLVVDQGREKDLDRSGTDLASQLCYHLNVIGSLAVPMFDYIWKGEFEIHSSRRLPGVLCRIQAHLSTQSSPKIPEVVKKFSDKIHLEEVSRLNIWPTQFLKNQPQDDSIGLYFFAEDVESYLQYKSFLQCMIDYDVALKGTFNGIELLIFSSNLLPEKSRRWNKLLFLWGIFRQRKFITT